MTRDTSSTCGNAVSLRHALVTLSSNHISSALALSGLLIADVGYRAISVALTGLAVFSVMASP